MAETSVEDIRTESGDELFRVRPGEPSGPGVVFLHWFDEAPNANRSQFLEEARILADHGVTSVLPQLTFPWHSPPTDTDSDLARIERDVRWIRDAHRLLIESRGVSSDSIALVGHDFGAMHGMALFDLVEFACAVLIAPTPRWSDWFLTFWPVGSDRFDYMRALAALDPITTVTSARCPVMFQFANNDFYIAQMSASELFRSAPEPKRMERYDSGHDMAIEDARRDRIEFLLGHLGAGPG